VNQGLRVCVAAKVLKLTARHPARSDLLSMRPEHHQVIFEIIDTGAVASTTWSLNSTPRPRPRATVSMPSTCCHPRPAAPNQHGYGPRDAVRRIRRLQPIDYLPCVRLPTPAPG
jgi:hypothetical protein